MAESDLPEHRRVRVKRDLTGERFGRYTVIKQDDDYVTSRGEHFAMWLCQCDCGRNVSVRGDSLKNGISKSCGCYSSEATAKRNKKHGCNVRHKRERIYTIWSQMISRCTYAGRKDYIHYGGRGIKVCAEWMDFVQFKEWANNSGYSDVLTLDRIDPNGNYEPNNCRWATVKEQQNNRRNNHYMIYNGEKRSMSDWAAILDIPYSTLRSRKNLLGWSDEDALTRPVIHRSHNNAQPMS